MQNSSGLQPKGRAILVKPYETQKLPGSIIELPATVTERSQLLEDRAIVVEIGPSAWTDERFKLFGFIPLWRKIRAKVGDHVIIAKFAGYLSKGDDGELYRLVNEKDIFCRIVKGYEHGQG